MPQAIMPLCVTQGCPNRAVYRGRCDLHKREVEQQRPNLGVRKWYYSARWAALRAQKRWENPLCFECWQEGRAVEWTDLDHIRPHRGQPELFWDSDNLRGLCAHHHSRKTARGE